MEEKILSAIKMLTELHMSDEKALELIKDDNTDINEVFYLDSFSRVQLIIELEEIFNIEIEMEHISNDIFMSSKALKNLIKLYIFGNLISIRSCFLTKSIFSNRKSLYHVILSSLRGPAFHYLSF